MKYTYIDITSGIMPLRAFLKIRDTSDVHAVAREKHTIGLPTLVIDDEVYIPTPDKVQELIDKYQLKNTDQ